MQSKKILIFLLSVLVFSFGVCAPCYSDSDSESKWDELLKREPFIYTVPRVNKTTSIDGVYVKKVQRKEATVPCRRCPDWLANSGIWRIYFSSGVYRIINLDTGWKSIGTYIVSKNRLVLFNDPSCINGFGLYRFVKEKQLLTFYIIDDPCAISLRSSNLSEKPWLSCYPPNEEAAISEHWVKPSGCRDFF